jgi:hypothetical protein
LRELGSGESTANLSGTRHPHGLGALNKTVSNSIPGRAGRFRIALWVARQAIDRALPVFEKALRQARG